MPDEQNLPEKAPLPVCSACGEMIVPRDPFVTSGPTRASVHVRCWQVPPPPPLVFSESAALPSRITRLGRADRS